SEIFRREKPDIIYHRHSVFNFSSIVLARRFNIPVILEVNYSEVWAKKNWSRLIFERLAVAFEKIAFKNADLIVVVSEIVKDEIMALGANEKKIVVNPNAADPEAFSPNVDGTATRESLGLNKPDKIVVGFIGTFTKWHGVEILMDAIKAICGLRKDIHFLLIGDGNLKSQLEMDVATSHLESNVLFTGLIPHSEAPKYLAACDILVSPHLGFEDGTRFFGSPTKLFEYMAMGKPIIASDLEQIGTIIEDGINGILV
ncbi:MAG: glycosyltransferase family 4 protein, partial [Bacteroidetes bacterium]|nr:glycosyltransferase family 4 protein [Bacteroidota bacterium]